MCARLVLKHTREFFKAPDFCYYEVMASEPLQPKTGLALAAKSVVADTYVFLAGNLAELLRRSVIPVVVMTAMLWIMFRDGSPLWLTVLAYVPAAAVIMHFAVSWHQLVMFGPSAAGSALAFRFGARELKFFGCLVLFSLFEKMSGLMIGFLTGELPDTMIFGARLALSGVGVYFLVRFLLLFPLVAAGHDSAFRNSWALTRGHEGGIFLVVLGIAIPLALLFLLVLFGLIFFLGISPDNFNDTPVLSLFSVFYVLATAVVATALSKTFLALDGHATNSAAPSGTVGD